MAAAGPCWYPQRVRITLGLIVLFSLASCRSAPAREPRNVCIGWHCHKPLTHKTTESEEPLPNPGETGELRGTVTGDDNGGAPLAEVIIFATSPVIPKERMAATDAKGVWALPDLPPGTYEVTFEYANNSMVHRDIEVKRGQARVFRTINFPMDPTRGYE